MLTAINAGCVAFSLPVQRRNFPILKVPAFSRPLRKVGASRAADQEKRVEPERRRSQATFVPGTVLRSSMVGARMDSLAS